MPTAADGVQTPDTVTAADSMIQPDLASAPEIAPEPEPAPMSDAVAPVLAQGPAFAPAFGAQTAPALPRRKGIALAALIVGIAAFLTGWAPVLGIILGLAAVTLGIIALVRRQSKGFAIPGVALGAIGLVASIFMTLAALVVASNPDAFFQGVADGLADESATVQPNDEPADEAETGTDTAAGDETAVDVPTLAEFAPLDDAGLAALVADPNAAVGATHIVYGEVQQFDDSTGACSALIAIDDAQQAAWEGYAVASWIFAESGDTVCPEFAGLAQYSHVKAWVTVAGATPTEFEDGTSQDVLTLAVRQVESLPALP